MRENTSHTNSSTLQPMRREATPIIDMGMYREERVVAGSAHHHAQRHADSKAEGCEPKPGPRTGCVILAFTSCALRRVQLLKQLK